jgi:hypothetical protein
MMLSPWGLLSAAEAEGLGPCSRRTPGGVLLSESEAQPSGTRREHEPNGCGESRYETKRGNDPVSMVQSCRSDRKVNTWMPRTVNDSFKRIPASFRESLGGFNTDVPLAALDPIRTRQSSSQHVWHLSPGTMCPFQDGPRVMSCVRLLCAHYCGAMGIVKVRATPCQSPALRRWSEPRVRRTASESEERPRWRGRPRRPSAVRKA